MIAYLSVLFLVSSNLLSFLLLKSYTVILPIQRNVLVYLTGFIIQSLNCLNSVIVSKQLPQWCRISPFFYIYINSIQLIFLCLLGYYYYYYYYYDLLCSLLSSVFYFLENSCSVPSQPIWPRCLTWGFSGPASSPSTPSSSSTASGQTS